tara:strand:+ start:10211 stop:11068 length:858 start_codon:yes stop_codon:yes gene_type:complete
LNKKVGILGGGFGLYGYLPAFANLQFEIFTLSKYENFIKKRPDLSKYIDKVNFLNEEKELIKNVDYINIARNPESQYQFLIHNKPYSFKHLYIEKPIAHQTIAYKKCIENFETENTSFSVFYSLTYMDWYNNIIEEIQQEIDKEYTILWKIKQKSSSWKQDISRGGGMLKFYGIHFIQMFIDAKLTLKNITMSKNKLEINLESKNINFLTIFIESSDKNSFSVYKNKEILINSSNPFLREIIPELPDPRIEILEKYIQSDSSTALELEKNTLIWLDLLEQSIKHS